MAFNYQHPVKMAADKLLLILLSGCGSVGPLVETRVSKQNEQLTLASPAESIPGWGKSGTIIKTSVVWKSPKKPTTRTIDEVFHPMNHFNPLWHFNNSTYFVWIDANYRPWVTKIKDGKEETAPLDQGKDYTVKPDGHNRFSMGIDKNGYLHITGDMHNYTDMSTQQDNQPYVQRYQKRTMLYWMSKQPESVAGGFVFAGAKGASTAMPGTGWTYGRFFTNNSGELFYSARVKAIAGGHASGEVGLGLYRYDVTKKTWTALGGLPNKIREGQYQKVLLWENAGMAPNGWYQGFQSHFRFDKKNRLHMVSTINSNIYLPGNNRLIYAQSLDEGLSWRRADGTTIPSLPLRAANGQQNQASVVADRSSPPYFNIAAGFVMAEDGTLGSVTDGLWRVWNGTTWTVNKEFASYNAPIATYGNIAKDDSMILTIHHSPRFLHAKKFNRLAYGYDVGDEYSQFLSIDEHSLRTSGKVYGIAFDRVGQTESILQISPIAAPLPCAWQDKDIWNASGKSAPGYAGMAGFSQKTFVVTNYGMRIDNNDDSFHFTYGTMTGDGSILARVDATTPGRPARAGVMMRDHLTADSKHVMMVVAPKMGAMFGSRISDNAATNTKVLPGFTGPYWVKMTRKGNTFTGSYSQDGKTWAVGGVRTIPMKSKIYIGLASASYVPYKMQTVKFSNVAATGCSY